MTSAATSDVAEKCEPSENTSLLELAEKEIDGRRKNPRAAPEMREAQCLTGE